MLDPISIGLWLLTGVAVGAAVVLFWDEIRSFFIESFQSLPRDIQRDLQGVVVVAKAIDKVMTRTSLRYYSYNAMTQNWSETIDTKAIRADEVPDHIRNRLRYGDEIDITNEVARELKLHL